MDGLEAAGGLVEQGGDSDGAGLVALEMAAQEAEGDSGIEDVFDDDDVAVFDGLGEVFDELYGA